MIKLGGAGGLRPLAEAVVDLDAIAHNIRTLAGRTGAELLAVVKADGFGHGLLPVARTVLAAGVGWLGVTSRAEALTLRAGGVEAPVLSWLHAEDEDFAPVVAARIDLSAASSAHLRGIAAGAARAGVRAEVHLKVDTGLSRNGATDDEWPELVRLARRFEAVGRIRVRGVWSHLAGGESPGDPRDTAQLRRFDRALALARAGGLAPDLVHLANSAALVGLPETHFDLVRAGIAVYGVEPRPDLTVGLRPAMTLRSRVILTKRVAAGTGISYGHDYVTAAPSTLALVPVGYADGVPRAVAGAAEVWIQGRRCPIAGRVTMDQIVVDVGDLPVRTGDEVLLFGPGDRGEPTVVDWAGWAGTNPHEIFTGIGARVGRRYLPVRAERNSGRERVHV
ncbi:alanine racemase [Plantactinospora endophytica]|uniref:Alanine racemase n=1 Tax=Plantactinospora endophytica TaxID=673535 RepID=A0ABQ4EAV3_9ACTN|nr:alanine racemase [Plantactinospora endophytica]GIG91856.1 alanine racemase [Plantactinospora endophytica]